MSVPDPQTSPGRRRRRTALRHALIRWLGGTPVELLRLEPASPSPSASPLGVPMPRWDPRRLEQQARHYFEYAEEVNLRGAPELAATLYRQAYALMDASVHGVGRGAHKQGFKSPEGVDDSVEVEELAAPPGADRTESSGSTALPETAGGASQPTEVDGEGPAESEASPFDPIPQLPAMRERLSRETAAATLSQLQEWRGQGFRDARILHLEGMALMLLGKPEDAETQFRTALEIDPDHYGSLVNLSGLLLRAKRHADATPLLQHALTLLAPESLEAVPALTNLSLAHELAGRSMEAAQLILKVHRLKPGHIRKPRVLQAARTLEEMGDDPDAIELLRWLREQEDPGEDVLRLLAELLERRGDFQEAALVYRELLTGSRAIPQV